MLTPAHLVLPDCPVHSYASTVSALIGAMYPETWQDGEKHKHPYLLLFTLYYYRRRPLHIPKSDRQINPNSDQEQNLNGVRISTF